MFYFKMWGVLGFYLVDCNNKKLSRLVCDEGLVKCLWDVLEVECWCILGEMEEILEVEVV